MMENQSKKSTAGNGGKDRISELPEELLHYILRHIPCPKNTAQTSTLSSRWQNLWRSYPVAKFNFTREMKEEDLQKFVGATMIKFSPENLLLMEALEVSLDLYKSDIRSPSVEQLLGLASKKKAGDVAIKVTNSATYCTGFYFLCLPLGSLSNSSARTLHLERIKFESRKNGESENKDGNDDDDLRLSLDSLLHMRLDIVEFRDPRHFTRLIASSPLLRTLEICSVKGIRKLNLPNVKTLKISRILDDMSRVFRKEFIAPQLNTLEIAGCTYLRLSNVSRMVSKLENLKSLTLCGFQLQEKELKLSCPKLEEFNLWAPPGLEEIELNVKPCFRKFCIHLSLSLPGELKKWKKCEIHNAAADCRWEVDFFIPDSIGIVAELSHQWLVELKSFIIRFPQFRAISISCLALCTDGEEEDHDEHPLSIEHLKIMVREFLNKGSLNGLFGACHPRFLTVGYEFIYATRVLEVYTTRLLELFLKLASHYSDKSVTNERPIKSKYRRGWLRRLKDVKIKPRGGEQTADVEEEIKAISEKMATSDALEVCFELTWY